MLTPEQIAALRDWAGHIADPINDFLLEDIARRISEAGQLTSTASYQVWRAQNLGMSQRQIKKELKKLLKVSNRELRKLLTQSAEVGYDFDIKHLPRVQAVPFHKNGSLQQIVEAAVKLAQDDFTNLTQTLGMIDPYGNALPLQDAYRSCTDYAFKQVITGAADYNTAIRRATKLLADKGVQTIDYESGVHTSLEAAVRRNIMGGLGLMQEQITQHNHDELGCDGWEISAHANSAPDHEPIQGKQYSDAEYEALNNSLVRRIGTLNCGHAAFPIILGVNEPQYTQEQLDKFREDNARGVTVDGRHYTGYEATQMQRKIERAIRARKRRVLVAEATGDTDTLSTARTKLVRLRQEYSRFSKAAGLRTENERMQVAGFGRKQAAKTAPKPAAAPAHVASPPAAPAAKPPRPTGTDVLVEYIQNATPGVGSVTYEEGYNTGTHADEIKVAQWLHDVFGGDIVLLKESDVNGQKMPDYRWRGKLWDLKTSSTEQSANSSIKKGLKQIRPNPGGVILNFEDRTFAPEILHDVISERMQWYKRPDDIDIMIVSNREVFEILRYKGKK